MEHPSHPFEEKPPMFLRPLLYGFPVLLAVVLALSSCIGFGDSRPEDELPTAVPEDLAKVWEVYAQLRAWYVGEIDANALAEAAIQAMIEELDDPFTAYYDPEDFSSRLKGGDSKFEGIGASVAVREGNIIIVRPYPGSPAEKAGLQGGDIIRAVEGESTEGLTLQEVVSRVRGPKETRVKLSIESAGNDTTRDVIIERAEIEIAMVETERLSGDIFVLRIRQFAKRTEKELDDAFKELRSQGITGLVLDLRGNPGGLLTTVIDTADQFLDEGLVMYEINAAGDRKDWRAESGGAYTDLPMAVLVNGGSASGSEVLAGALQSNGRAALYGTQTFGKGVVTVPVRLEDGSGLYITTATWYTPSGEKIGKVGLTPDFEVARTLADLRQGRDPQLQTALEAVRQARSTG